MSELQRITSEYLESEDRIRLTGESQDGDKTVLWLTQRLLLRLVPHVCQWLEQLTPLLHSPSTPDARTADLMLGFAQQSATRSLPEEPPVRASAEDDSRLINSVDIKAGEKALKLVFKSPGGKVASITFEAQHLQQWLGVLHQLWGKAEWPGSVWPDWMESSTGEDETTGNALH